MMGIALDIKSGTPNILAEPKGKEWHEGFRKGGEAAGKAAFDLITQLERVAGQYSGRGGDQQFRLYVHIKPESEVTLVGLVERFEIWQSDKLKEEQEAIEELLQTDEARDELMELGL